MKDLLGDDAELIANTIEGETNVHAAIESGLRRLLELDALMYGIDGLIANLKDRGERFEAQRDSIRTAISVAMDASGMKRFESALGTISVKAVPPKVMIVDEAAIPSRFWKPSDPKLDKKAILAAIKDKEDVPGAMLSNGSSTIQLKVS
jgi:hypothetical protein